MLSRNYTMGRYPRRAWARHSSCVVFRRTGRNTVLSAGRKLPLRYTNYRITAIINTATILRRNCLIGHVISNEKLNIFYILKMTLSHCI